MKEIRDPKKMQKIADALRRKGLIGFVPTMGGLHKGHLSLLEDARKENDFLLLSIFVNPLQFAPSEDYEAYPRQYKEDCRLAKEYKVDYLFSPSVSSLYPEEQEVFVKMPNFEGILCGRTRPSHFQGVLTIVAKLFNITKPHNAYFGQKDYQQAIMIKKMVAHLNFDIDIKILPTIRTDSGLALSSRNSYLSKEETKKASIIYQSLLKGAKLIKEGEREEDVIPLMKNMIENEGLKVEYIEILDKETLKKGKTLIAIACKIGKTRLIDNIVI